MAYINKVETAIIRNDLKAAFPAFRFSVRMRHHMAVTVTILSGPVDFQLGNDRDGVPHKYMDVTYNNPFDGLCADLITEMLAVINKKNFDNSDIQSDYFSVGFYLTLTIGDYNKPYVIKEK